MDIRALYEHFKNSGIISTDTRKITPGCIFFALKGDHFNGNEFAEKAIELGASLAVIDDVRFREVSKTFFVEDVLTALQDLARHHRSMLSIPVIGLTGSNGKTTSKELVHAVLSKKFRTQATTGNLNNHIGVPLTILSIKPETEIAVIEMGANHVGEIALLSSIANPTHGFITNIGKAHIGTFGGFENIIRGKTELYQHLINSNGTVFVNSQNPIFSPMIRRFTDVVLYPAANDFIHVEPVGTDPGLVVRADGGREISSHLTGVYNFENIAVALCIGKYFGVSAEEAAKAVEAYIPSNMRSQMIHTGTNRIILDAYNANPSSMEAAILNLRSMPGDKKIAIVGDMYELGDDAESEHLNIGILLNDSRFSEVFLCGLLMSKAKGTCPEAKTFDNREALLAYLNFNKPANSTILIKASRGMGLEKLMEVFQTA